MNIKEFQVYIEGKKKEIDEAYSNEVISEGVRDRLYSLYGETEKRYEEIRTSQLNDQIQLAKLEQANRKLEDIRSEISLRANLVLFDLECALKELKEKAGR